MIRLVWPSYVTKPVPVWRLLDLSGMTNSVRESRNYTKAGYTYLDGRRIQSLKMTVDMGKEFTLELRFPNGVTRSTEMFVFPATRHTAKAPRSASPFEVKYKP